jgi:hypothetical protein
MRRLIVTAALCIMLALEAGCSAPESRRGGPPAVLAVQAGITGGYKRNTNEIIDIGLALLHSLTGHTIRLQSVQWVNQHRDSGWFVVITFSISKPGVYHFDRAKIRYVTDGQHGWQYQNLDTSYHIIDPPLPGPVPIPRSGICG